MPLNSVSRETEGRLKTYLALLEKWQAKINLISPTTLPDAWDRHFVDSAQVEPLVPYGAKNLYDLGCGAGFPGLVLAIMRPELSVSLIESDAKKCAFLQTVSRETGASAKIENRRIEDAAVSLPAPDVISARALASLDKLLDYCAPWITDNPALVFIFPKGAQAQSEIDEAARKWEFQVQSTPSITDSAAQILVLSSVRKR